MSGDSSAMHLARQVLPVQLGWTVAAATERRLASGTRVRAYRRTAGVDNRPGFPVEESAMSIQVPDVCTLPTVERLLRQAEFAALCG